MALGLKDIKGHISVRTFHQVLTLWEVISEIEIMPNVEDK